MTDIVIIFIVMGGMGGLLGGIVALLRYISDRSEKEKNRSCGQDTCRYEKIFG